MRELRSFCGFSCPARADPDTRVGAIGREYDVPAHHSPLTLSFRNEVEESTHHSCLAPFLELVGACGATALRCGCRSLGCCDCETFSFPS